ncbi:hypothetical protein FWH58_01975 [Candidatus Saccharibacteria bacterium]|nr:hypothetical protein [Candidatus Saccharibacteria bacterium]
MFSLDEKFIEELGIANQPDDVKEELVVGIEKTIQDRVLLNLSDQITDFLADEITGISESVDGAKDWLGKNIPHYAGSSEFARTKKQFGDDAEQTFAQMKWFEMNLPNYLQEIQTVTEQVKQELLALHSGGTVAEN